MDFKYLYETGYKEHRNELSESEKAFFAGYGEAYQQIENFMANADCYEKIQKEISPTLAKIDKELRENVINDLRHWLRMNWYQFMVEMIDELSDKEHKVKDEYAIPEPLSEERVEETDD